MRRLSRSPLLLLLAASFAAASCARLEPLSESSAELLSEVDVADPAGLVQLVHGFSKLEFGQWRWTRRQFGVVLRPPEGSATAGARLELSFDLPPVILERLGSLSVQATVNGLELAPESYAGSGPQRYSRDVPAVALRAPAVAIEFWADKAIPPDPQGDDRELALIARGVALRSP